MSRITSGFDELDALMKKLPQSSTRSLQSKVIANHLDHKAEVIASSKMKPEAKANLKWVIRVFPGGGGSSGRSGKAAKRVTPKRLEDVTGETVSFWKGFDEPDPAKGTAARIEKSIGGKTITPRSHRFLLIPTGDFVTPSGRARRVKKEGKMVPIDLSKLPDTRVVNLFGGKKILVQRLKAGEVGDSEREAAKDRKKDRSEKFLLLGTRKKLKDRERKVGVLVKAVKGFAGLDFFGAWNRLTEKRSKRYDEVLDAAIAGKG